MKNEKCIKCSQYKNCRDSFVSWLFFIIGIISTVAIRVVTVLIHKNPIYANIAWYIGVCGFFVFFVYKFKVNQRRAKLIEQKNFVDRIAYRKKLSEEDYSLIGAILCSLKSRKERINYLFIFGLSAVALLLAIYFDFLR